jgi:hypothetical protein
MKFAGFLLVVVALAPYTCHSQSQPNPSQFDVDGVRLGMSVDEAYAALQTYGFKYIAKVPFGSRLGKEPFIGALVGMTGTEYVIDDVNNANNDKGDHVSVLFTETEGKAYSIDRTVRYGNQDPIAYDVLLKRVKEKYGDPTPPSPNFIATETSGSQVWVYDPTGKPLTGPWKDMVSNYTTRTGLWSYCAYGGGSGTGTTDTLANKFADDSTGQIMGNSEGGTGSTINGRIPYHVPEKTGYPSLNKGVYQLYYPLMGWSQNGIGLGPIHSFGLACGITLRIHYAWTIRAVQVSGFEVSLFDSQLASRNYKRLVDYATGIKTKQLEENRKKSEQQKPF